MSGSLIIGLLLIALTVIFLLLVPLITMRTYSEEKRSGTMELLLTSPITDLEIVLGKFAGALALYAVMLAVSFWLFRREAQHDPKPLRDETAAEQTPDLELAY